MSKRTKPNYKPAMALPQALSLLADLAELEVQSPACPNPPPGWLSELSRAAAVTRQFLKEQRPPAGPFFLSAPAERQRRAEKNLKLSM